MEKNGLIVNEEKKIGDVTYSFNESGEGAVIIDESNPISIMINEAMNYLGEPYAYDPTQGVDCSQLISNILKSVGIELEAWAEKQAEYFRQSGEYTVFTNIAELQQGDLVYLRSLCVETMIVNLQTRFTM